MNQVNRVKLQNDLFLAETVFGPQNVYWDKDFNWIMIKGFKLPNIYNKRTTNCLIIIPSGYGYGSTGLEEFYLDSDVRVKRHGQWERVDHSYDHNVRNGKNYSNENWHWLCIHPQWRADSNIITFLKQVDLFLKYPFTESLV